MNSEMRPGRPGRPLGFDRGEALDRLMTLFWRVGYDGVTQQQMAAATGLSTSSLYNSFGTKPEVFLLAVEEYLRRMTAVTEPLTHGDQGRADMIEALNRLETVLSGPNAGFGCLATAAMSKPVDPRVAEATRGYRDRLRLGFQAALERARNLGETAADPVLTAQVLTAAVLGTLVIARADGDGNELSGQLRAARRFVESC